jgi:NAD-dependent dihydropyrimidine dehydrogenase PreA subunit
MVDIARFFLSFSMRESCGNCTPCRVGTRILHETLEKIARGEGEARDLDVMRRAADTMTKTALCGLGQAAANPVVTTLANFLPEYEAHIQQKYCPAAQCKGLFEYTIIPERCNGCGLCVQVCPAGAIQGQRREPYTLDASLCTQCRNCVAVCARNAILGLPVPARAASEFDYELIL